MATELIARFKPGENVPAFCAAQVFAGRFVMINGAKTTQGDYQVVLATAGAGAFGVAERDSGPTTHPSDAWTRRVNVVRRGAIAWVIAGAAVAAGAEVGSDATGRAVTYATGKILGRVVGNAAAAAGDLLEIDLY
jgi:hypothetical protein